MTQKSYSSQVVTISSKGTTEIAFPGNYLSIKSATLKLEPDLETSVSEVMVAFAQDGDYQAFVVGDGLALAQGYERVIIQNAYDYPLVVDVKLAVGQYTDNRTTAEVQRINEPVTLAGPMALEDVTLNPVELQNSAETPIFTKQVQDEVTQADVTGGLSGKSSVSGTKTLYTFSDDAVITGSFLMGVGDYNRSAILILQNDIGYIRILAATNDAGSDQSRDRVKAKAGDQIILKSLDSTAAMTYAVTWEGVA